jgi:hypothetical protein
MLINEASEVQVLMNLRNLPAVPFSSLGSFTIRHWAAERMS